jgi:hypothetical protein
MRYDKIYLIVGWVFVVLYWLTQEWLFAGIALSLFGGLIIYYIVEICIALRTIKRLKTEQRNQNKN